MDITTLTTIFTITSTVAGLAMAICQVPQAVQVYKTKSTKGMSLLMQIILTTGIFFWFISGVVMMQWDFYGGLPMALSNGFCLCFCVYILAMCIKNRKN